MFSWMMTWTPGSRMPVFSSEVATRSSASKDAALTGEALSSNTIATASWWRTAGGWASSGWASTRGWAPGGWASTGGRGWGGSRGGLAVANGWVSIELVEFAITRLWYDVQTGINDTFSVYRVADQ
jgi:hypothetical protein